MAWAGQRCYKGFVQAPWSKAWRYGRWFVRQLGRQFREDGCAAAAAALTFTTMIAVVPFVAVVYRILSLMPEFAGAGDTITGFVFETFLPGSSDAVLDKVREFSARANELTLIGVAVLFVTTILMLMRMEEAFNRIWHVASTRAGMARFLSYWGVIAFGVPMVGLAVTAAGYDFGLSYVTELRASAVMEAVRAAVPPMAAVVTFTMLYYVVPSCRVRFPHAFAGGLVATLLFTGAQEAFALLVPLLHGELVYGALAALPLFVLSLYLVWVIIPDWRDLCPDPVPDPVGGRTRWCSAGGQVRPGPHAAAPGPYGGWSRDRRRDPPRGADDAQRTGSDFRRPPRRWLAALDREQVLGAGTQPGERDAVGSVRPASRRLAGRERAGRRCRRNLLQNLPRRGRGSSRADAGRGRVPGRGRSPVVNAAESDRLLDSPSTLGGTHV